MPTGLNSRYEGRHEVDRPPIPDLIKVTEIFLVPGSFLVAALGTADTNPHRAAVSVLGLVVSVLWWFCGREALQEHLASDAHRPPLGHRLRILMLLPMVFAFGWTLSIIAHVWLWNHPLGK